MPVHDIHVGKKASTELHRIAVRIGEVVEREIEALGFQDEELEFVLIAVRKTDDEHGETGMVATVDLQELAMILHRNLAAILGPEAMKQYAELELGKPDA